MSISRGKSTRHNMPGPPENVRARAQHALCTMHRRIHEHWACVVYTTYTWWLVLWTGHRSRYANSLAQLQTGGASGARAFAFAPRENTRSHTNTHTRTYKLAIATALRAWALVRDVRVWLMRDVDRRENVFRQRDKCEDVCEVAC